MAYKKINNNVNQSQEVCKVCENTGISLIKTNNVIDFTECSCGITSDVIASLLSDLKETQGIHENFTKLGNKLMQSHHELNAKKRKIIFTILLKYNNLSYSNEENTQKETEEKKNKPKNAIVTTELTDNNCRCKKSAVTYRVFKSVENDIKKSYRIDICRCNCEHVKTNGCVPEIAAYQEFLRNEWTSFEISAQEYSDLTSEYKIEIVNNFSFNLMKQWDTNAKLSKIRNVNKIQLISKVQSFLAGALDKIHELEESYKFRTMFKSAQSEQKEAYSTTNDSNVIDFASKTVKLFEGKKFDCPLVWFLAKHPIFPLMSKENKAILKRKLTKTMGGVPAEQEVKKEFKEYGTKDHDFIMTSLLVSEAEERFLYYMLHMWYKKTSFEEQIFETTFNEIHKMVIGKTNISHVNIERYREYLKRLSSIKIFDRQGDRYFGILNTEIPDRYNDKGQQIVRVSVDHMIFRSIKDKQFSGTYLDLLKSLGSYAGKIIGFALCNDMKKMMDMSLNRWKQIFGVSDDIEEKSYLRRFQDGLIELRRKGALETFEIYKSKNTGEKTLQLKFRDGYEKILLENIKKHDANMQEKIILIPQKAKSGKVCVLI